MRQRCVTHSAGMRQTAFSLIEITLAIGLLSFCLLALFGLLSVGSSSIRDSKSETVAVLLAERALGGARGTVSPGNVASSQTFVPLEVTALYDQSGRLVTDESKAYFHLRTTLRPPQGENIGGAGAPTDYILAAMAEVSWPYRPNLAPSAFPERWILTGLIARPTDAGW